MAEPQVYPLASPADVSEPDQAWKALSITNEWVRHADTKVGVTLAFVGATGTILYNLVKNLSDWGWLLGGTAAICGFAIFFATGAALMALFPRTTPHNPSQDSTSVKDEASSVDVEAGAPADKEAVNLLFYGDIARTYRGKRPTFVDVFRTLTSDKDLLTGHIAHQSFS